MTLSELQNSIKKHKLDAYIITRSNMFIGQDVLDEENPLLNLTSFSGSAGTLVVTPSKTFLLVDGRYEIQAARQTDKEFVEVICGKGNLLSLCLEKLFKNKKAKIGFNSLTNAVQSIEVLERFFPNLSFVADDSAIFENNLCGKPCQVFEHKLEFCGIDRNEKIGNISKLIGLNGCDAYLFTAADSVSWLLNLRSNALPDTPLLRAYALLDKDGRVALFGNGLNFETEPTDFSVEPLGNLSKRIKNFKNKTTRNSIC